MLSARHGARSTTAPRAAAPRTVAPRTVALRTAGALAAALLPVLLAGCGSGGTNGGSGQTGFVTDSGGVATLKAADRTAGPELAGRTLEGAKLDVASYQGKVVVLNVWGSWCPPCRQEAPNFAKVAKDTAAKGVQFVGINTRDTSTRPARAFEETFQVPYPSLYDPAGKLMLRFPKGTLNPQAIPSTVVLDRRGRVAARSLKPLSEHDLRRMVDPLIAEK
jgi:thiol-disulfide isomerase/thioredoxin